MLLFYVLPLYIASKNREKRSYWEIPMAAQTFALFTLLLVFVSVALGPTLYIFFGFSSNQDSLGYAITPFIEMLLAIYPIYIIMREERKEQLIERSMSHLDSWNSQS